MDDEKENLVKQARKYRNSEYNIFLKKIKEKNPSLKDDYLKGIFNLSRWDLPSYKRYEE